MVTEHEGLKQEFEYVTKPAELEHIKSLFTGKDPLMHETAYALIKGDQHEDDRLSKLALDSGFSANDILDDGLIAGMAIVGVKFRDNVIFVPEVLIAARAMKAGMAHIEPILSESGVEPIGTVIMGTVKGDLHDIGKNLCIMMLRGSGFEVCDFLKTARKNTPPSRSLSRNSIRTAPLSVARSAEMVTYVSSMFCIS